MKFNELKERNVGTQEYMMVDIEEYPKTSWESFKKTASRTFSLELFKGLGIVFGTMKRSLFNGEMHTTKYPMEKLPISPRYRGVHKLLGLLESGTNRCIGCGLCEKICISNCIKMDTVIDKDSRKEIVEYSINLGRCIFCGYCAEVCPELAIVHGEKYENASEQRAQFVLMEDLLTPFDQIKKQFEYDGFGAISPDADKKIKKTPLAY
jgi:NADH-quinone oxidoreductase subunit I